MSKKKRTFLSADIPILQGKLKESVAAVLPIVLLMLLLSFTFVPLNSGVLLAFLLGGTLLIVGMAVFTLGTELAMTPIGESVGAQMTKTNKLGVVLVISFVIGVIITIAEPDLQVLAGQIAGIPRTALMLTVAVGVGVFLALALLRIIFKIKLSYLLLGLYACAFILAIFVPEGFLSVAFDSGGVTTGPMTVPFIMAMGVGVQNIRTDKNSDADSFGLVALCSIGPIIAVMILGLVYKSDGAAATVAETLVINNSIDLATVFVQAVPSIALDVALVILPITVFFLIYQLLKLKLSKMELAKILVGIMYTYVGLVLFLVGAHVGFMSTGRMIGEYIGGLRANWIIIPIGMLVGYFIVSAEPAIHVLNKQVYEMTLGAIPQKALKLSLSVGVAISVGLAMCRALYAIPLMYVLIPGYVLALGLTFVSPPMFTAIAFDSGGVASGPMTATFLSSLTIGVCTMVGGNTATDAFGLVALVAMTPLITIQLLGVYYKFTLKKRQAQTLVKDITKEEIIENPVDVPPVSTSVEKVKPIDSSIVKKAVQPTFEREEIIEMLSPPRRLGIEELIIEPQDEAEAVEGEVRELKQQQKEE